MSKIGYNTYKEPKVWDIPRRRGIYLELKKKPKARDTLFYQFLNEGFLLPPSPSFPLILHGELLDGEEAKLAAVLGAILL